MLFGQAGLGVFLPWFLLLIIWSVQIALFGLLVLLADSLWWPALALLIGAATSLINFGLNIWLLAAVFLGFLFTFWGAFGAVRQKNIFIKISLPEILKPILSTFFTALILIFSVVFSFSPPIQDFSREIKIPRSFFNDVVNSTQDIIRQQIDVEALGAVLDQKAQDNLYSQINNQISSLLAPYKQFLPYGLASLTFVSLYTMKFIFIWLALGMIKFLFYLMKKTELVKISKVVMEKEIIEL